MHYVTAKSILSAKNGMNLYRGCSHGCIYCDSRSHCYQMNHAFEDIEVKENAVELLEDSLKRKRQKCMIGMGSMTDPYIPLELELEHTRKSLELIEKYGFGATLITKSDRVLRDLDLLKKINEKTKCVVQMTLTNIDDELSKKLEPGVCPTTKRFEVLKTLRDAGIPTVVWMTPILPFINDTKENVEGLLDMCLQAQVKGIICFGIGLTLREGNREYFYKNLDVHFPGIKEKYIQKYGNQYELSSPKHRELWKLFHQTCEQHGIMHDNDEIFKYLSTFEDKQAPEQMSLWDLM